MGFGRLASVSNLLTDRPFAPRSITMSSSAFLKRVLLAIVSCRESDRREFPPRETAQVDAPETSVSLIFYPLFEVQCLLYPR